MNGRKFWKAPHLHRNIGLGPKGWTVTNTVAYLSRASETNKKTMFKLGEELFCSISKRERERGRERDKKIEKKREKG